MKRCQLRNVGGDFSGFDRFPIFSTLLHRIPRSFQVIFDFTGVEACCFNNSANMI